MLLSKLCSNENFNDTHIMSLHPVPQVSILQELVFIRRNQALKSVQGRKLRAEMFKSVGRDTHDSKADMRG